MPQMAPMNWLFLYMLFTVTFLLVNFMNYYLFMINTTLSYTKKKIINKTLNWKW